jgi:hypothetical protein
MTFVGLEVMWKTINVFRIFFSKSEDRRLLVILVLDGRIILNKIVKKEDVNLYIGILDSSRSGYGLW